MCAIWKGFHTRSGILRFATSISPGRNLNSYTGRAYAAKCKKKWTLCSYDDIEYVPQVSRAKKEDVYMLTPAGYAEVRDLLGLAPSSIHVEIERHYRTIMTSLPEDQRVEHEALKAFVERLRPDQTFGTEESTREEPAHVQAGRDAGVPDDARGDGSAIVETELVGEMGQEKDLEDSEMALDDNTASDYDDADRPDDDAVVGSSASAMVDGTPRREGSDASTSMALLPLGGSARVQRASSRSKRHRSASDAPCDGRPDDVRRQDDLLNESHSSFVKRVHSTIEGVTPNNGIKRWILQRWLTYKDEARTIHGFGRVFQEHEDETRRLNAVCAETRENILNSLHDLEAARDACHRLLTCWRASEHCGGVPLHANTESRRGEWPDVDDQYAWRVKQLETAIESYRREGRDRHLQEWYRDALSKASLLRLNRPGVRHDEEHFLRHDEHFQLAQDFALHKASFDKECDEMLHKLTCARDEYTESFTRCIGRLNDAWRQYSLEMCGAPRWPRFPSSADSSPPAFSGHRHSARSAAVTPRLASEHARPGA